jgi:hypothetical protein
LNTSITTGTVERIRELAADLDQLGKTALEKAKEAGGLLREAKESLPHGGWLPWLESNFTFTDRTARRWMKLSEDMESGKLKSDTVSNLTEAYRLSTNCEPDKVKCPFKLPLMGQRLLLISKDSQSKAVAALEPIDDTYIKVSFTEADGEICETRRGIHREWAWAFLVMTSDTCWDESTPAYAPWYPPTDDSFFPTEAAESSNA